MLVVAKLVHWKIIASVLVTLALSTWCAFFVTLASLPPIAIAAMLLTPPAAYAFRRVEIEKLRLELGRR